ncbi:MULTISPECIES: diguanylate cyclase [unclassified Thioalkalivibrio]|uniref:diguanylate cyclase n=1 Tax=unclassified Thioalkalivibrio TaxID=2621013 RepID=UPI000365E140|nr:MULTISPECIES: diguanylate cyclase [unclassified Thioalkalivibrio]
MRNSVDEEVRSAVREYLDAWLRHRDANEVMALNAETVCGFGTGMDEAAFSPDEAASIIRRDIEQAPEPFDYMIQHEHVTFPHPEVAIAMITFAMHTRIHGQQIRLNELRGSLVFRRTDDGWRLAHLHGSFPTTVHGADEPYPIKELEDRAQVLDRMVSERTRDLEAAQEHLERLATTDPLTGLHNRLKGNHALEEAILQARRDASPLTAILMDLDHFKTINDQQGHARGDHVLRETGHLLRDRIRSSDTAARWGGEEFLILCPNTTAEQAANLAEALRHAIEAHDFGTAPPLTASFGVTGHQPGESAENLIARADEALYAAKRANRNRVETA